MRRAAVVSALLLAGCAGTPSVSGVRGASPSPEMPWTPPAGRGSPRSPPPTPRPRAAVPPDLADRVQRLTLTEIVDLGLRNNPTTRLAWANAADRGLGLRLGAGGLASHHRRRRQRGAAQDRREPGAHRGRAVGPHAERDAELPALRLRRADRPGRRRAAADGGRELHPQRRDPGRGAPDPGRLLPVPGQPRPCSAAQRTTLEEAQTNLTAAEERRRVGLATVADVLQARTAASQARLDLQTIEGNLQTTRGALALALGLPANLPYDVDSSAAAAPVAPLADSVNAIIATALQGRPDLAATQAEVAGGARGHRRGAGRAAAVARVQRHRRPDLRHHHSRRRQQLHPVARAHDSRSSTASPGSTTSARRSSRPRRRGPGRSRSGRKSSSRSSAPTTRSRPRPAGSRHGGGPARQRRAVERSRARPIQGRRGERARSARRADGAGRRPRAAGGGAAGLERIAGAARARRGRARPPGRQPAPAHSRHHEHPSMTRRLLAASARPPRGLRRAGRAAPAAGPGHRGHRRAARRAVRAGGHRHGRAAPDRGGAAADRRADRADRVPRGAGRREGPGALPDRPAPLSRRRWRRPRRSSRATAPRRRTRSRRRSATPSWPSAST